MNIPQEHIGTCTLSDKNADPTNWEWKHKSRAAWQLADATLLDFRNNWYGNTDSGSLGDYESPFLELIPLIEEEDGWVSSLFVRPSYVAMFHDVLTKATRMTEENPIRRNGIIITGQPGTGKSLFGYYLLVRLLQLKQVVLYTRDGQELYLFYHDGVYTPCGPPPRQVGGVISQMLPKPISPKPRRVNGFIWSLFDIHEPREPPNILLKYPCLPVQTASPNPIRYGTWLKTKNPVVTGLPLWTREELAQGLRYQLAYEGLVTALCEFYAGSSPNDEDPLSGHPGIRALLEGSDGGGDTLPQSPEDAIDYLLDAAIQRFGYSARDVFSAVFDYDSTTKLHKAAIASKYSKLQDALSTLFMDTSATNTLSDDLFALSPIYDEQLLANVCWEVDFKSDWVSKNMIWTLDLFEGESDDVIRQQVKYFKSIYSPRAHPLARRLLEPLVHRYIANGNGDCWLLRSPTSNNADPPCFTLVTDSPVARSERFFQVRRTIIKLQSIADLSKCLETNSYYIPVHRDFTMFDAFTVELDRAEKSAILWVIQVTTSRTHGGSSSSLCYKNVRKIVAIVKDELRGEVRGPPPKKAKAVNGHASTLRTSPSVEVRYLIVVPKLPDETQIQSKDLQWEFPKGWSQNRNEHDHCGNVYRLEVPLAI